MDGNFNIKKEVQEQTKTQETKPNYFTPKP
jgi:hypothetical protein